MISYKCFHFSKLFSVKHSMFPVFTLDSANIVCQHWHVCTSSKLTMTMVMMKRVDKLARLTVIFENRETAMLSRRERHPPNVSCQRPHLHPTCASGMGAFHLWSHRQKMSPGQKRIFCSSLFGRLVDWLVDWLCGVLGWLCWAVISPLEV